MSTLVQLTGGKFQDAQGNVLTNGYLTMALSQDEEVNDSLICSGVTVRVQLDANGSVVTSPAQYAWANDQMLPVNSFYKVTGFTQAGQPAWGPNNQQIIGSGGTFDVGTWIPNQVIVWVPPVVVVPLDVEVEGVPLSSSTLLDFINTGNVVFTDNGTGQVSANVNIPPAPVLDFLPQPDSATFAYWLGISGPGGGWLTPFDTTAVGFSGSSNSNASATSGATLNLFDGGGSIGQAMFWPTRDINFKSTFLATFVGSTNFRFFGITNVSVDSTGPANPTTGDCIGIEVTESTLSLGNFKLVTSIGGSATVVDSGIPVGSNTRYSIGFTVHAGVVTLFINEVAVATSSNLPTANALFMAFCQNRTAGFVDFSTSIEYMYCSIATL